MVDDAYKWQDYHNLQTKTQTLTKDRKVTPIKVAILDTGLADISPFSGKVLWKLNQYSLLTNNMIDCN